MGRQRVTEPVAKYTPTDLTSAGRSIDASLLQAGTSKPQQPAASAGLTKIEELPFMCEPAYQQQGKGACGHDQRLRLL